MGNAIEIRKLTRKFNGLTAVDKISLDVAKGEVFGLLGPNGAGKTTTINMLSTLIGPTSGTAKVSGSDIKEDRDGVRRKIGIVFQEPALDGELTGKENMILHTMLYGMAKKEREEKISQAFGLVDLDDKKDILVGKYSGGMKRRLEIARGLTHNPDVLFLDEPTLGLDAQTRRAIWEHIKKLKKEVGLTIILTTHYMEEADYLCDRIAIIDKGKVIVLDTPENLKNSLGGDVIRLKTSSKYKDLSKSLGKLKWVKSSVLKKDSIRLVVDRGEKRIPGIINHTQKKKAKVTSISLHKPSLEEVFIHYTGKSIRDHESERSQDMNNMMRRRMK